MDINMGVLLVSFFVALVFFIRMTKAEKKVENLKPYELFLWQFSKAEDGKETDFSFNWDKIDIPNTEKLLFRAQYISLNKIIDAMMTAIRVDDTSQDIDNFIKLIPKKLEKLEEVTDLICQSYIHSVSETKKAGYKSKKEERLVELKGLIRQRYINDIKHELDSIMCVSRQWGEKFNEIVRSILKANITLKEIDLPNRKSPLFYLNKFKEELKIK